MFCRSLSGVLTKTSTADTWYVSSGSTFFPAAIGAAVTGVPVGGHIIAVDTTSLTAYIGFGTTISQFTFLIDSALDSIVMAGECIVVRTHETICVARRRRSRSLLTLIAFLFCVFVRVVALQHGRDRPHRPRL
jgi:cytochrome bd-type quinol oxidase subunit 2